VTLLPHRTEKTKRVAAAVLKATNEWYASAYFSYNEHKKEIYKFYREEVLELEWKRHPPKKLGSVYGLIMRLLFEWDTTPLIKPFLTRDGSGEFELPSGCESNILRSTHSTHSTHSTQHAQHTQHTQHAATGPTCPSRSENSPRVW
jgi:hypothetical protein